MPEEVDVIVHDQTGAIQQKGFGLPLIFDPTTDAAYEEVEGTDGISGWTNGNLAYEQANIMFTQEPAPDKVAMYGVDVATAGTTIADELDDLITEHNDWYWGIVASRTESDINDFSDWIASKMKIGAAQLDMSTTLDGISTFMDGIENQRMFICAHDGGVNSTDQYLAAGLVGRLAALEAAEYTAKFKTINTVTATKFKPGEISTITGANCNTYVSNLGKNYVSPGVMTNGDFIDTQVAKDWFSARYREEIFRILKVHDKISYDDIGIAQIEGALKSVNKQGDAKRIVARDENGNPMMSTTRPLREDIPDNDIANRTLSQIESNVVLGGAIHEVTVDFYLTI
ncbi:DUF3383 family protein [Sporohalobacter salinus]|uniref:DUF3383 family protein n=1 Tax=Sporohalobacter salinus TaxID=1494606 RepID=UPI0019612666|nr:DUF3383 family protein [Sporohalobacter salinus]MBM7623650.1 hypothetical protein [Sporohalobacter salinus]